MFWQQALWKSQREFQLKHTILLPDCSDDVNFFNVSLMISKVLSEVI